MERIAIEIFQNILEEKTEKRKVSMEEIAIKIFLKKKKEKKKEYSQNYYERLKSKSVFAQYKRPKMTHEEIM